VCEEVRDEKSIPIGSWCRFCAGIAALSVAAFAYTGEELASEAQVNVTQARAIAQKVVPGDITDEELETEEGGSGLRYTVPIAATNTCRMLNKPAQYHAQRARSWSARTLRRAPLAVRQECDIS
jgi:hypothetical protein